METTGHIAHEVLREMVRLAEKRRSEELEAFERLSRHNLSLIAFDAGFLSLMITMGFGKAIVAPSGLLLLFSIAFSLLSVRPRTLKGGSLSVEDDIRALRAGEDLPLREYLLETAELTERAAETIAARVAIGKRYTILSACFLALALLMTYTLYVFF